MCLLGGLAEAPAGGAGGPAGGPAGGTGLFGVSSTLLFGAEGVIVGLTEGGGGPLPAQ